jgi:predicted ATPase
MGNLPVEGTRFVGREAELSAAASALRRVRLLTLTGAPGVGKTRLALRIGTRVRRSFPDGVWFVELSSLQEEDTVTTVVAETLGVCEATLGTPAAPARDLVDALVDRLADCRLLLILDNCEHVIDAVAHLVHTLLRRTERLRVLTTGRRVLGIGGEHVLPVPALPTPDPEQGLPPRAIADFDAIRLFADRAAAASARFRLSTANLETVTRLCRRLDGNPLAIELAAVRVRAMPVERILQRLDDYLDALGEGSRVAVPRLRAPRAVIGWSHRLCTPGQRALWRRLTIFNGGFDLAGAETICAGRGIDRQDVCRLLIELVDMSIVIPEQRGAEVRYRLPEMIREFGHEALLESSDHPWLCRRHGEHYLRMAQGTRAEPMSRYRLDRLARLRSDRANLQEAADHWLTVPGGTTAALEISIILAWHYLAEGLVSEGRAVLSRPLQAGSAPTPARAEALWLAGWLALLHGHVDEALTLLARCRVLATRIGDASALRRVVQFTGLAAIFQGRHHDAEVLFRQALADHQAAGDIDGQWLALFQLALVSNHLRAHERAIAHGEQALAICRRHDAPWAEAHTLWVTAIAELGAGRAGRADSLLRDALRITHSLADRWGITRCVEALGWTRARTRPADAAVLLGLADRLWRSIGSPPDQMKILADARRCWDAHLRDTLGADGFCAAFSTGRALTLDDAIARVLGEDT